MSDVQLEEMFQEHMEAKRKCKLNKQEQGAATAGSSDHPADLANNKSVENVTPKEAIAESAPTVSHLFCFVFYFAS